MFRLFNNRFTFYELENDEKIICWLISYDSIAHLQKAPINAGSENVPDSQSLAYRRTHYHLFKQNVLNAHI